MFGVLGSRQGFGGRANAASVECFAFGFSGTVKDRFGMRAKLFQHQDHYNGDSPIPGRRLEGSPKPI